MSVVVEGASKVYLGAQAFLVEEDRELAWAEAHVIKNPALKYILGRFVEADRANENGHIFDLNELPAAQRSIANSPLNMLHRPHYIVGNFVASEMIHPLEATAGVEQPTNACVEALAAFYRYYFPEEFATVEAAHKEGALFYSMECVPKTVKCAAVCGATFAYDGRQSPTYCAHLNAPASKKRLGEPWFTGGALIIPPSKPGWKRADITALSSLLSAHALEAEAAHEQISTDFSHLEASQWEQMVAQLVAWAHRDVEGEWGRDFSVDARKKYADEGIALADGTYPLPDPDALARALRSIGKDIHTLPPNVKGHFAKRASAMGQSPMLPEGFGA